MAKFPDFALFYNTPHTAYGDLLNGLLVQKGGGRPANG